MTKLPAPELVEFLLPALRPCKNFGTCPQAIWSPVDGHIPRGPTGAFGSIGDVKVVLVFAEPGHPHVSESYDSADSPEQMLRQTSQYAFHCLSHGKDLFHRNIRWFLSEIFPGQKLEDQLKRVWLTEGRLCSIENEIGNINDMTCAGTFLKGQLDLLPNAVIVGCGGKAQRYLRKLGVAHLSVFAFAPPGANFKRARPSWEAAIAEIKERLRAS